MGKSAMPGVPGRFGTPHTLWLGVPPTAEPEPYGDPRGARRVKSTAIGVGFPPVFRPVRSDLFLERCRAIFR